MLAKKEKAVGSQYICSKQYEGVFEAQEPKIKHTIPTSVTLPGSMAEKRGVCAQGRSRPVSRTECGVE